VGANALHAVLSALALRVSIHRVKRSRSAFGRAIDHSRGYSRGL
jgi:hypothetical protein